MASFLALNRLLSSTHLPKSLCRSLRLVSPAPSLSRSFNWYAGQDHEEDDEDVNRSSERFVLRRRGSNFFSDLFDSLPRTRTRSQQFTDNPILSSASRSISVSPGVLYPPGVLYRGWDVKETEEGLYLRTDMPGLSNEDAKVCVEQNTLIIKGEGGKDKNVAGGEKGSARRWYLSRIQLPENLYNIEQVKAEMRNGVLNVVVPKIKEEDRACLPPSTTPFSIFLSHE